VFSWPTKLISDVHVFRVITAAMNTYPLLFVAFEAVICAPSGDQLREIKLDTQKWKIELQTSIFGRTYYQASLRTVSAPQPPETSP
jgi:hypothetical protein